MAKLLTRRYFASHPLMERSAARFEYSLLVYPDSDAYACGMMRQHVHIRPGRHLRAGSESKGNGLWA